MLADRFGLPLSTPSAAARDAYVDASERALTFYPGALAAYDSAISADPNFALAHAGKAQVLMREGNVAGARAALTAAKDLAVGLTEREASHIANFRDYVANAPSFCRGAGHYFLVGGVPLACASAAPQQRCQSHQFRRGSGRQAGFQPGRQR